MRATEALTSAAHEEREKKISSDHQLRLFSVCRFDVNMSKSTCKLVPSVPGFAGAKLGIKNESIPQSQVRY